MNAPRWVLGIDGAELLLVDLHAALPRIDAVVVRSDNAARLRLEVLMGQPSAAPSRPLLPLNSFILGWIHQQPGMPPTFEERKRKITIRRIEEQKVDWV